MDGTGQGLQGFSIQANCTNVCTYRDVSLQVLAPDLEEVAHIVSDRAIGREGGVGIEHRDELDEVQILGNDEWTVGSCGPESNVYAKKFLGIGAAVSEAGDRCLIRVALPFAGLDMIEQIARGDIMARADD